MLSMIKIAIIEDNPVISQMYRVKFESDGFDVQTAKTGKQGVALVKKFLPDLILFDPQILEMNGVDALTIIRKSNLGQDIPVIITANFDKEELPKELESLGIHSYIVKVNLTPKQVVRHAKEALNIVK